MTRFAKMFALCAGLCFLIATAPFSLAQPGEDRISATVNINAEIVNIIEMTTLRDLVFPQVGSGRPQLEINPVFDSMAGLLRANGRPGAQIRVSFSEHQELINRDTGAVLPFRYVVSANSDYIQESSELIWQLNREFQLNENGEFFFWIGGVAEMEGTGRGHYTGEFTIEIEYI